MEQFGVHMYTIIF